MSGLMRTNVNSFWRASLVCSLLMLFWWGQWEVSSASVLGQGDGLTVTSEEVEIFKKVLVPKHVVPTQKELLRVFLQQRLFAREAKRQGLAENQAIETEIGLLREKVLARAYAKKYLATALNVDDKVVESYYLSHIEDFTQRKKLRLSRLVVEDEHAADLQYEDLKKDTQSFPDAVEKHSVDPATKWKKGEMGSFSLEQLKPEVRQVVTDLPANSVSTPMEMKGFYYIFWVQEIIPEKVTPLAQVRDRIRERAEALKRQEILRGHGEQLERQYRFHWVDENPRADVEGACRSEQP